MNDIEHLREALRMIATGRIVGHSNDHRETVACMRAIAERALAGLPLGEEFTR